MNLFLGEKNPSSHLKYLQKCATGLRLIIFLIFTPKPAPNIYDPNICH